MKRPLVASLTVAAILLAPAAASAATAKHHHRWHHAAYHHSVRAAYGMVVPGVTLSSSFDPCDDANLNVVTVEACDRLSANGL
jgi:hypothetical protein